MRDTGRWWTTAEAIAEGYLDPDTPPGLLEDFIKALPKLWTTLLMADNALKFRVHEFVARIEDHDGGLVLEIGRVTKKGDVRPVQWDWLPSGEGIMLHPDQKAEAVVWSLEEPGVRVDLMQAISIRTKGLQKYWAPGLVRDFAFQPWDWSLRLNPDTIVSLPECSQRRLTHMLNPPTRPAVWGWYARQDVSYSPQRIRGLTNFLIRATDPRPLNVRETVLKYVLWVNRHKYLVQPTTCLDCGEQNASTKHGLHECRRAQELWREATSVMSRVLGVALVPPSSWHQTVTGLIDIRGMGPHHESSQHASGEMVLVWMTIHGAAVTALHHSWCDMRHNGTVPTRTGIWARFRNMLLTMTVTAFRMDVDRDRRAFWTSWGKHGVLGKPERVNHPATLLALPGVPVVLGS